MNPRTTRPLPRVRVQDDQLRLRLGAHEHSLTLRELPPAFVRWQIEDRRRMFEAIGGDTNVPFHASHLPVLCTVPPGGERPNLANKGIGLLPREEHLEAWVRRLEGVLEAVRSRELDETRPQRIEAARAILDHPGQVDWRRFGLLEIFEGTTFENLREDPRASLLFTGSAPEYLSFQVDGVVEIAGEGDLRYRFARAMRGLFEGERFHVMQSRFPFQYTFWVTGWREKTPKSRAPHGSHRP